MFLFLDSKRRRDIKNFFNKIYAMKKEDSFNSFINRLSFLRPDLGFLSELLIDEKEYFRENPDVEASKIPAIRHYILYGQYEGRVIKKTNSHYDIKFFKNRHEKKMYLVDGDKSKNKSDDFCIVCSYVSDFKDIVESLFSCNEMTCSAPIGEGIVKYAIELAEKIGVTVIIGKENESVPGDEIEFNKFINSLCQARPELKKGFIMNLLIDSKEYFRNYPDVKISNISAVQHYFTSGYKENRNLPVPKFIDDAKIKIKAKERYLYFSNAPLRDGSFQYRCVFQSNKYPDSLVYNSTSDIRKLIRALFLSDTLIFSRPEVDNISYYMIQLAKRIGVSVEFDFDDLLLPEYSDYLGHVRSRFSTPESANKNIISKLPYLYLADSFRCTTPIIKEHLSKLGKPVSIHQNKLPIAMSNSESDVCEKLKDISERKVNLIYLSGTATHKKDYSVAHGSLIKLAQLFPNKFTLTFLGNTQQNLSPFKILLGEDNVNEISRVSFQEMLDIISRHDVALVPLENTIFNNAKSNIKFIECGCQGTPVIASAVDEFKFSISNDEDGWLCSSQSEWFEILSSVVNNKLDLLSVSLNAKEKVEKDFMIGVEL